MRSQGIGVPRTPIRCTPALRLRRVVAVLIVAFCAGGCATQDLKPGTGDLSFRLLWSGEADLDLHAVAPNGEHTGVVVPGYQPTAEEMAALVRRYKAEQSGEAWPEAGVLDVDCNASPDRMCARPIENVFWAPGTALRGEYRVWAVLFQRVGEGETVEFTLEIRRGERVVETRRGLLNNDVRESQHYVHSF